MSKTKNSPPVVLPNDVTALTSHIYLTDAASSPPFDVRIVFAFPAQGISFDHALSEYTTVTPAQKLALKNTLLALRDETYTLENYVNGAG